MSKHKATVPVNIVASIKLMPAICSMIVSTVKEKKATFAERVNNEVEYRKNLVLKVTN